MWGTACSRDDSTNSFITEQVFFHRNKKIHTETKVNKSFISSVTVLQSYKNIEQKRNISGTKYVEIWKDGSQA